MRILKKGLIYVLVTVVLLGLSSNISYAAASTTLQVGANQLDIGESTTISVSISNTESWNLSVSANGGNLSGTTSSIDAAGEEVSKNVISCQFTANVAGTYTISLLGNVAGSDLQKQPVAKSITITVNEKTPPPSEGGETPSEPETPPTQEEPSTPSEPETPPTQEEPNTPSEPDTPTTPSEPDTPSEPEKPAEEPNFTASNRLMYATGDINLRASWSTASEATRIEKDTELTVTATSTNTVNGYVWYRVSYNGQTKYVAAYLLTDVKPEEEEEKSNNAYLKSLTVEGQELLPTFDKEVSSYSVQVKNDVTEIKIKAVTEDEKATVDVKGNKDLKEGENTVTVSVSAEDGTIKIYEIKVTRLKAEPLGLSSLKIKDTNIENKFKTDIYEYSIDIEDVSKLEIEAIANDEKATVEILGNEDLQEGENIITIIVSSEDGEEKVTYQIKASKEVKKVEPIVEDKKEPNNKIYFYIAIVAILVIALIIVVVYVIKNRNNEPKYVFTGDYDDEPEDLQEDFPEELPERKETKKDNYFLDNDDDFRNRRGKHF